MSKLFINLISVYILASLLGCASGPAGDSGASSSTSSTPMKPADVDSSTAAAFNKAVNAMKNGRDDTAMKQFQAIAQTHPDLASAFVNIGLIHLKYKRYEKAEKNLLQATTIQPADPVGQTHLGLVYRHLGKFKEAQQAYDQALKSDPKYSFAHLNAGILYDIYLNNLSRALNHYQQYQALTNNTDKKVDKWIIDLQRRVKNNG
ncbi:hypothetical protein MNBD_GAMMA21-2974 [hydrothermal vent metagenome]|uniref:Uncharacterized protein n=1 Tax=hydrothermal vent metagenome TaxID=652676 RepID=A0A3B0ZLZ2_9ZZZZ